LSGFFEPSKDLDEDAFFDDEDEEEDEDEVVGSSVNKSLK